ncbi:MAG: hypothetical protein ISS33_01035 [Candidatus Omnitrophica bacterium]|nr:hypothetical protein [Candidatus Omnitrophota bacterium]
MREEILPEFQRFLIAKGLGSSRTAPYHAYWVGRFLSFSNDHRDLSFEARMSEFFSYLRGRGVFLRTLIPSKAKDLWLIFQKGLIEILQPFGLQDEESGNSPTPQLSSSS